MIKLKKEFHSRSKFFACLLTFCAGFIDAYTFIERGGTLVAGQTGNVVLLSVAMTRHNINQTEVKIASMVSFMLGIFLFTVFQHYFQKSWWRLASLFPLIAVCAFVGTLPKDVANVYIVPPLAFCMGLVATAFGEVGGIAYNNAFMTGNIKKTMVALGMFIRTKEKNYLKEGSFFASLLGSFVLGAIISAYFVQMYSLKTIYFVVILLLIFLLFRFGQYIFLKKHFS